MTASARAVAEAVHDPELPDVTLGELGVVGDVVEVDDRVVVELMPTYLACPATYVMADDVARALRAAGWPKVDVRVVHSPPWTSDRVTAAGREKLARIGVAPPPVVGDDWQRAVDAPVACPRCGSRRTRRLGDFGATSCRAPYVCHRCREPFERFKPI